MLSDETAMSDTHSANNNSSHDDRSTDLQTTLCADGRHINVRNPQSGSGEIHTVTVDDGHAVGCTCKGWTFNRTCYHVDAIEASPLLTSSAQAAAESYSPIATDGGQEKESDEDDSQDDRFRLPEDPKHVPEDDIDDDSDETDDVRGVVDPYADRVEERKQVNDTPL